MPEVQKGKKTKFFTYEQTPAMSSFASCVNRKAVQRWPHGQVAGGSCYSIKKDEGLVFKRNACECVSCARWFLGGWVWMSAVSAWGSVQGQQWLGVLTFPQVLVLQHASFHHWLGPERKNRHVPARAAAETLPVLQSLCFASLFLLLAIFTPIALN